MPECVKIFHNMQDMSGYVKFCQHMLEIIRICQDDMTMVKSLVKIWSLGGAARWWQPHSVRLINFFYNLIEIEKETCLTMVILMHIGLCSHFTFETPCSPDLILLQNSKYLHVHKK